MTKATKISPPRETVGIDLGDRFSHVTILDKEGALISRCRIKTTLDDFGEFLKKHRGARVAFEVGSHSPWVNALSESLGCETIVANPRAIPLLTKSHKKNDIRDANLLADLAHAMPSLLSPIHHRDLSTQVDRCMLKSRKALVDCRTALMNSVRGMQKMFGTRIPKGTSRTFHKRVDTILPADLRSALKPLLEQIGSLTVQILAYDKLVDELNDRYPETELLRQVNGVGSITALSFVLTVEDPKRFARSRDVGAYLGLVPKSRQSGNADPELRITKAGDRELRSLLVQCGHYILGPFGQDCYLRRFGKRLEQRGGKNGKRRAVVAVARKLAVLLHVLWVRGAEYDPMRNTVGELAAEIA